jgi:hypothetical protein
LNQEQLLDHVAELLHKAAEEHPNGLILLFDEDFKVYKIPMSIYPHEKILGVFDAAQVKTGLPPSVWLDLAKKVWACKSSTPGSIKFPGQPSAGGGKPGRKKQPKDEDPQVG